MDPKEPAANLAKTELAPGALEEKPGSRIGRYKLLEQIGEGGCGVVYVAEQEEPVRRRVALKVIKLGMDTRQVIARFEAERQALALMDHPNIAKVLDGGATERGRPFFVMELVKGVRITDYCDRNNLSTAERLGLFVQVCHAIQHAHQKGIIHRDIKPSNILVTLHDGVPVPKVIDFGIAKATTDQRLTDKTVYTAIEQFIGTPAYMSPEQAELSGLDIDTRSDIYALGVLLYELLTGKTPFDAQRLVAAGLDEIRRIIREEDPPRPSTRISTLDAAEQTAVAKRRHAEPPKLIHLVRGDLDWIVMKCLEKDRTRRYDAANGLAEDIERFLGHEPVLAAPPRATDWAWKFIRRHRVGVATTAALAGAMAAGLGAALIGFAQARRERDRAESEAATARAVNEFLTKDFLEQASPDKLPERDVKLRTVLDRAATQLEKRFQGKPLVEAPIRETLSTSYYELGEFTNAWFHLNRALEIYSEWFGRSDARTLRARRRAVQILRRQGRYDAATKLCQELLPVQRRVLGLEHPDTLETINTLARVYVDGGDWGKARHLLDEALPVERRVLGSEHLVTIHGLNTLAVLYAAQGQLLEARGLYGELLAVERQVLGPEHPQTFGTTVNLGDVYLKQGRASEAQQLYEALLPSQRRVMGPEHPQTLVSMINLAEAYGLQGKVRDSEQLYEEVLPVLRRVLGSDHPITLTTLTQLSDLRHGGGLDSRPPTSPKQTVRTNQP